MKTQKLVLTKKEIRENMISLFKKMEKNSTLRKSFAKDPVGILTKDVVKTRATASEVSDSNRLLFSLLANNKFLEWLVQYSKANKKVSKEQYAIDLIKSAVKFGDKNILASIAKYAASVNSIPGLGPVAQQLLINNAAGSIVATPVNQPSTSDQTLHSSQNFNNNQSGVGFGDLSRVIDPALIRSVVEMLVLKAKELDKKGVLQDVSKRIA